MATAAGNENEETECQSDSLTQESDEIQEMYCENCEKELGTTVRADGFCVECMEYLCSTCLRYHKKYVPDHTLQDSANMPQDFCFEKCQIHKDELTKFYCKSCDQIACPKCKTEHHKECTVDHIPTLIGSTDIKKDVEQINLSIDQNLEQLATSRDNLNSKLAEVYSNRANASASIKKKIQEEQRLLDEQLEQADEKLNNDSEKLKQTDKLKLQAQLSNVNKTGAHLTDLKKNFQSTIRTGQKSKAFLAVKTAKYEVAKLKTDADEASEDTEINQYKFQPCAGPPRPDAILSFGSLIEKCKRKRKISKENSILISDTTKSKITGLCKLSNNFLVAADNNNSSIKLIDTKNHTLLSTLQLEDKPFGVTKAEDNELAATLPDVGRIQFLSITQNAELVTGLQLAVKKNCHGIMYKKPNFIVSFSTWRGEVEIMDKNGTILKNFSNLKNPVYIALNTNKNMLYIHTAKVTEALTKMSTDGDVIATQPIFGDNAVGLAVDKVGTIYICCACSNNIIQMSADLQTKHKIHVPSRHQVRKPSSIFYCSKESQLYVGGEGVINAYKVE
ncbi:transcription intermediary factor 1-alpha-like [Mercenaria mercenaria]|uniref:transcription intermediary factor 1-alpha-like n=1 Tax=Mercenaria mercenaria TaxID=6596 RepID=UPI00234FA9CB|nr:transcription intermediary factor 1-alpha-like [Mercenaria mercenaria]